MATRGDGFPLYFLVTLVIMAMMCAIDYFLGERVILFNSWTLVALTANRFLGLALPHAPGGFIAGGWHLGRAALPLAWVLFVVGPALLSILVVKLGRRLARA